MSYYFWDFNCEINFVFFISGNFNVQRKIKKLSIFFLQVFKLGYLSLLHILTWLFFFLGRESSFFECPLLWHFCLYLLLFKTSFILNTHCIVMNYNFFISLNFVIWYNWAFYTQRWSISLLVRFFFRYLSLMPYESYFYSYQSIEVFLYDSYWRDCIPLLLNY